MTEATSQPQTPGELSGDGDDAHAAEVRDAAARHASKHKRNPFVRSATGGRVLSALMLPFVTLLPPAGFGVITTTGRRTGKGTPQVHPRDSKRGQRVHRDAPSSRDRDGTPVGRHGLGVEHPRQPECAFANPRRDVQGVARELKEPAELQQAREAFGETVNAVDYAECELHLRGLPRKSKVKELHRYWFDTGIPLVVDLAV